VKKYSMEVVASTLMVESFCCKKKRLLGSDHREEEGRR